MKMHTPPMTFNGDEGKAFWAKQAEVNNDPYGGGILTYASEWATRMEAVLTADPSKKVADIAQATSREADDEGITGFMYGAAVAVLSKCWVHGEELRRWHNKDIAGEEKGEKVNEKPGAVINPAIINIG